MENASSKRVQKKIKIILDTDIGDDIDDTWALIMMLKCKELEPVLITTAFGDTTYRTKLVCKLLEVTNRTDIPVGTGTVTPNDKPYYQGEWIKDYNLDKYPGIVHKDGVDALIQTIMKHTDPDPIALVCIGPLTNIGEAITRNPDISKKVKFIGMLGSVRKGYANSSNVVNEYNVRKDVAVSIVDQCIDDICQAAKIVFNAPWPHGFAFTPLDTCALVKLEGEKFKRLANSTDVGVKAIMDNYKAWAEGRKILQQNQELKESSILFDTVAVYMAFATKFLVMEKLRIVIDDQGYTKISEDKSVPLVDVATDWTNLGGFNQFLVERLLL